jgi:hypothetical protein
MRRPFLTVLAATSVAGVLLTGCGGGSGASATASKDPKTALNTSFDGLTNTDALTVTLRLDTTPDKLVAMSNESGKAKDRIDAATAKKLTSASIVLETKTTDGSKLGDVKPGQTAKAATRFAFVEDGQTLAQFLARDNALYLQAKVEQLLDLFGQKQQFSMLQSRVSTMPAFAKSLLAGDWVSLDLNALKALGSQFGGAQATPSQQQTQKLMNDLRGVLTKDVTVTRVGTDDQGDHLKLATHTKALANDFLQTVQGDIPAAGLATGSLKPQNVPDRPVSVDAWVKDGALSKVSIDVVQFAKPGEAKAGDSLPVVLQFERSGDDISKPSNAVPVDTTQLFTMLGQLGGR